MSTNKIIIHQRVSAKELSFPDALQDQPGLHITEDRVFRYIEEEGTTEVVIPNFVNHIVSAGLRGCTHIKSVIMPEKIASIAPGVRSGCLSLEKVTMPKELTYAYGIPDHMFKDCVMLEEIVIPGGVEIIGCSAFENCRSLKRVVLSAGLNHIYDNAFRNCTSLKEILIPEGTVLWDSVFQGCDALQSVTLPQDLTTVSEKLFCGCKSLKNIVLPDTVSDIRKNAFEGCTSLTSINLPSSLKEVGDEAFMQSGLRSVAFPSELESIGEKAFYGCENLSSVRMPPKLVGIGIDAFAETGYFENHLDRFVTLDNLMLLAHGSAEEIVHIPGNVRMIAKGAFSGDQFLRHVILPNGLRRIDDDAFNGCPRLDSVYFPCTMKEIGRRAFKNCCSVTEMEFSEGMEHIDHWAFENCTKLKEVRLPDSLEELGGAAFQNCTDLKKVVFSDKRVIEFLPSSFFGCDSLKTFQIGRHRFKVDDPGRICDTNEAAVRLLFEKNLNISSGERAELIPLIVQIYLDSGMPEAEQYIRENMDTVLRNLAYTEEYTLIERLLALKDMVDDAKLSEWQQYFWGREHIGMFKIIRKQIDIRTFEREFESILIPEINQSKGEDE